MEQSKHREKREREPAKRKDPPVNAQKSQKSDEPKKRKLSVSRKSKFPSYSFSLNQDTQEDITRFSSSLQSYTARHHYHSDSDDNSESESEHSDTEFLRERDALHLARIQLGKEHYERQENYPAGKGNGRRYKFTEKGVKVYVRFDKEKESFYPRVSTGNGKDKTTLALSKMLESKSEEYVTHFMKALHGEEREGASKQENTDAFNGFNDGIDARVTVLHSDALDYPSNSIVTNAILRKATPDNYEQLFVGDELEGSYGAIPSQNTNSRFEKPQERSKVYGDVGSFTSTGKITVSQAKSNFPTLRKFRSMLPFAGNMIAVTPTNTTQKLSDYVEQTISANKQDMASSLDPNGIHISEDTDMEKLIAGFTPQQRELAMKFSQTMLAQNQASLSSQNMGANPNAASTQQLQISNPSWMNKKSVNANEADQAENLEPEKDDSDMSYH